MTVAAKAQRVQVNISDQHGMPCVNLPVHAISFARAGAIDELEATEITDSAGGCYFDLDEPCFIRPMLSQMFKRQIRIQIISGGGGGAAGIMKHAVVDQRGFGTHTTITAAIAYIKTLFDAGGSNFVIHVNPGTYLMKYSDSVEEPLDFDGAYKVVLEGQGSVIDLGNGDYNGVVNIRNANPGKNADVITVQGGCNLTLRGLSVVQDDASGYAAIGMHNAGTKIFVDNAFIDGGYGETVTIRTSNTMNLSALHSIFTANNASGNPTIGNGTNVDFELIDCYLFGLPILKGDFGGIYLKQCFLQGNSSFGSDFLIQEENLVVSQNLAVIGCEVTIGSRAAGFVYFGNVSANVSTNCRIVGNQIGGSADAVGVYLIYADHVVISGNRFSGFSGTGKGVEFDQQVRGAICSINEFCGCTTGIKNSNTALCAESVIGPNAFHSCGTDMDGVDDANNFQVSVGAVGADIATHAALDTGVHGAGSDTLATDADIATHAALATVHQDAPALIATHATLPDVHHVAFVQGDADALYDVLGGLATHAALATVHQDAPGLISTHAGDDDAHHAIYTDADAVDAVEGEATLALQDITEISNDANFWIKIISSNPYLNLDANDYVVFYRSNNTLRLVLDSALRMQIAVAGQLELPATGAAAGIMLGGDAQWYRSASNIMRTPDSVVIDGSLELKGALNHDGANVGFFGVEPAERAAAYTPTNVTPDRAYDADITSLDELADILGTLIADLKLYGLLQ